MNTNEKRPVMKNEEKQGNKQWKIMKTMKTTMTNLWNIMNK